MSKQQPQIPQEVLKNQAISPFLIKGFTHYQQKRRQHHEQKQH
jgi:hypothetical protein